MDSYCFQQLELVSFIAIYFFSIVYIDLKKPHFFQEGFFMDSMKTLQTLGYIKIDMELHKVIIFPKNEDFLSELLEYLFENSPIFKREFSIDNILNHHVSPEEIFKKLSPIGIQ